MVSARRVLLATVAVAFLASTLRWGFPTGRDVVVAWLLALLLAWCGGDLRAWASAVVADWLPLLAVLFAYDLLRGQADGLVGRAHVLPQLRADELLFGGTVPTVWLQERLHDPGSTAWWEAALVPVYLSHFVVPLGVAAVLWARSHAAFRRYALTLVVLTTMALLTYALFPAAPPWLAAKQGMLPELTRVVSEVMRSSGIDTVRALVAQGDAYANPVAAIPSLHSAVPMMIVLLVWQRSSLPVRGLLVLYPLVMAFVLVYGAEHYVVDVLLGWAYAAVAVVVAGRVLRPWSPTPRDEPAAALPASPPPGPAAR
jgi:membrane-associated phospholipid phosphatase